MTGWIWLPPLVVLGLILGSAAATAQSVEVDEAVTSHGAVRQQLDLTPAQRSAIYNAVRQQRGRASTTLIQSAVGAPVSRLVVLADLPDQATANEPWAAVLKYAMVEDDVVVVDPVQMRVVDVIHSAARP